MLPTACRYAANHLINPCFFVAKTAKYTISQAANERIDVKNGEVLKKTRRFYALASTYVRFMAEMRKERAEKRKE